MFDTSRNRTGFPYQQADVLSSTGRWSHLLPSSCGESIMRRILLLCVLAGSFGVVSSAFGQPGAGDRGGPDRGLRDLGPHGGPGSGPDEIRRLQVQVQRLRGQLELIEERLRTVRRGEARVGGGFGGAMSAMNAGRGGFSGGFGPPSERGPTPGMVGGGGQTGRFGPPRSGPGGGFGRSPGGSLAGIDRSLRLIVRELQAIRREIHDSRR